MKVEFHESNDLTRIGNKLAAELLGDTTLKVKFLFVSGRNIQYAGKVMKTSPLLKFMSGYDLVILINKNVWDSLPDNHREALLFHELYHIQVDGDKIILKKHDVEEFVKVAERYGPWTEALQAIKEALKK